MKNILIIGASSGGHLIADTLQNIKGKYHLVGILDVDPSKHGQFISGVEVLGNYDNLGSILREKKVDEVLVAIADLEKEILYNFVDVTTKYDVDLRIIPNTIEKQLHDDLFSQVRTVNAADLLGRHAVGIDTDFVEKNISGKTILITGAAGSIGGELFRQLLKFKPAKMIGLDINENELYYLELYVQRHYSDVKTDFYIANVRERESLEPVFLEKPDIVFHAAAHKHVPLMERTPIEAIKNNVLGTLNVLQMTKTHNVGTFVLISTDKAVNPTSVMGATKRIAEKMTAAFSSISDCKYISVRFGNVLGSNGSVIPIFKKLINERQDLTLTDPDATRYFMTIPEAAQLVIESGCRGKGNDLFVLDMGEPVKIMTLAEQLIKLSNLEIGIDIKIKITGLRPGEKLHEELFYDPDSVKRIENPKIFRTDSKLDKDLNIEELEGLLLAGSYKENPREFLKSYLESCELN